MHLSNAYKNLVLQSLSTDDLALVCSVLEPISMPSGFTIDRVGEGIDYMYFLEEGVAFAIGFLKPSLPIEVGILGREGITGSALLMGSDRSPYSTVMYLPGYGLRISAPHLALVIGNSPSLHTTLLKFVHTLLVQISATAVANGRANLEHRLARWLLMVQDRHDGPKIKLTHDFMALMLGVRRPGVTVALQVLEGNGFLRSTRGQVHIVDRGGLTDFAGACYGLPEAEYYRVTGAALSRYVN